MTFKSPFLIVDIFLAALLFVLFYSVDDGVTTGIVVLSTAAFFYAAAKAYSRPVVFVDGRKSLVNAEIFLYIFFYILFFHPYIEAAFFELDLMSHSRFTREYIEAGNRAILASALGALGFSAAGTLWRRTVPAENPSLIGPSTTFQFTLLIAFAAFFAIFIASGGYNWALGEYNRRLQTSGGLNQVFMFTGFLSMIALGSSLFSVYEKKFNILAKSNFILALLWLAVLLMVGDRNNLLLGLVIILAFISLYYVRVRSIALIGLLAFALMAYNAIADVRKSGEKSVGLILTEIFNTEHAAPITETNFSTQTTIVRATIYSAPDQIDYFYGNFTLNALLGVVPYSRSVLLWWSDAPANSSDIVRSLTAGDNASYGTGTTIISDFYLDFGIAYVFFGMFGIGTIWNVIRRRAELAPLDHDRIVIYLVAVTALAQIGRYGIAFPIRYIGWTILFVLITAFISRLHARYRGKSVGPRLGRVSHGHPR